MERIIKVESNKDSLRIVEKLIDEISETYGLSDELYGNILIATLEAVNNAITHGNRSNELKMVELKLKIDEDKLFVTVKDEGQGFDFNNIPDPTESDNIDFIAGRGVFLIRSLSDQLEYSGEGRVSDLLFNLKYR